MSIFFPGKDMHSTGMTIRTPEFRYTEWVRFRQPRFLKKVYLWDEPPLARELYDVKRDFFENENVAEKPEYEEAIDDLRVRLRKMLKRDSGD